MGIEFPGSTAAGDTASAVAPAGGGLSAAIQPAPAGNTMFSFSASSKANNAGSMINDEELSADLVWGPSKSGKTTQLVAALLWCIEQYKSGGLLLTRDGGSLGELKGFADLGLLKVLPLARMDRPLEAMDSVCTGMWPVEHHGQWTFNSAEANHRNDKSWYDRFGIKMTESITSIGEFFQSWMAETQDVKLPQTPKRDEYFIKDGTSWRGCSAPSHVGEIHRLLFEWIHEDAATSYRKKLWTAREQRAEGAKGGTIIGPDAPGNKLTKKIGGWFGGCYHCTAVPSGRVIVDERKDNAGLGGKPVNEMEYRMYLVPHQDAETGIMCDAGNRLPPNCAEVKTSPYIVCNVERDNAGNATKRPGITTLWSLEQRYANLTANKLKENDAVIAAMKALGLMKDVSEI